MFSFIRFLFRSKSQSVNYQYTYVNVRCLSSKPISDLSFSSSVLDLGCLDDFDKTSIEDRARLSKIYEDAFINFFFLGFRLRVTGDLISKGFIDIMKDNTCFPEVRLFFFNKSNLSMNSIKPENLSHSDFVKLNNILGNQSIDSNNAFLFDKYNIIYSTSLSTAFC
jgi:hypothetical protein